MSPPFFINYAYHPNSLPLSSNISGVPAADARVNALQNSWSRIRKTLQESVQRQKIQTDRHRLEAPRFKTGDKPQQPWYIPQLPDCVKTLRIHFTCLKTVCKGALLEQPQWGSLQCPAASRQTHGSDYGPAPPPPATFGRTSAASKKEMWDTIVIGVNACGNSVRDKYHCRKRFDDIRSKLKKKIQDQRVHATGTGGGPTPQRLILTPLEELLRPKLLTVVVEGLAGDRDIGIYPSQFPAVAPGGHVSPEMEQVSSPGSASSTLLEEHHGDEDDEYDEDDATEETEIQSCDHEEVPIETVVPPNRPSTSTYDAIVASEGKIVDAENRRHSDMMTVLERMIGLQEETVSQLAHLHRVFIEVPKQLQKINTSFEALVVQQTQANYWRMTNVPQFNTSQPGSVHAGQFSPHSSDIHSPGPNVTGQVADIAVQVPDDILPLPSVQIQQQTPTKEATKTKQDTHETDQPSLVQCLPTCSHVSVGTSPVREQSLPKSPVGESLPKSPVGESLPKSPVGESLPKIPVGESLPKSPVGESLPKSPVGESLPKSPVGESLATSPVGESLATSPVGEQSLATSPAREVPEATQSGSVVPKVGGKRKRKIQETTSRPVTRSQKEQKK
ncbi:uncharacterized protein LOC142492284 [Ascaphus truei]|uniref:uncharacterized protein LOC142492284 n=1 Tax=Ascaphus truei TaxID=8439 RepID=UPI003F599797